MGRSGLIKVIYFNTVVSVYQSSVNSCLNIMTQIFDQSGDNYLGNVSVFLIFFFCLVGNFSCVTYVKKYPYRWMVFLHAIGYLFFLAEGILVTYCKDNPENQMCTDTLKWILVISGSSVTGFMASGFWVCQNDYISEAATTAEVGLFFGVGWALVQTSQLTGSLYSTYVITWLGMNIDLKKGQFNFFCVMFGLSLFASMFYLLIPQPQSKNEVHSSIQSEQQYDANYKLKNSTFEQQITQFFDIVKHPKVMLINFPIMITGILLGFQYNVMHVLIENSIDVNQDDEVVNSLTLQVIIALGAMEVVGGLATGWLNNKFKKTKVLLLLNQLFQVALLLGLLNYYVKNYTLCFVIAAVWGFVDCGTTTTLLALLSEHYGDDVRIYCNFNFFQCIGGILQTVISIIMKQSDLSNILLVLLGAQMIANMCIQMWSRKYST